MTTAGLTAPATAQVVGLSEDYVWAVVVELTRLGDGGDAVFGGWVGRGHNSIFADVAGEKRRSFDCVPFGHFAQDDGVC